MSNPVELSVRSSLSKIIDELSVLRDKAAETGNAFRETGNAVGEGLDQNVRKTESFFTRLRIVSRRLADQMRGDFKSLMAVNALTDSMKISNQFRKNIGETVQLSDAIRKLGNTFGIARDSFARFQAKMTQGLGEVGLGSEVAVRSLEGLSETPVRGEENLIGYSRTSGMLASVGRERGQEGEIAKSMARVIQARGGNVNDMNQVNDLAESLRRVLVQTGQAPTQSLKGMEAIFRTMPEDMRKAMTSGALTNLMAAGAVGGPNSTRFLEEYLSKSPIARMAFEAQGGKGVITNEGIDIDKFKAFAADIMGRVGGDPRLAAQTLGLSEEAAEGFVRLAENLDKVAEAQDRINRTTGNLNQQYRASMGLSEAFNANINRVKKALSEPLSWLSQKGTDILSGASESDVGAGAVVAGSTVAAAILAGIGLKGIGRGLGGLAGTVARKEGAEAMLGEKTVPVYVVNAGEIGSGIGSVVTGVGGAAGAAGTLGILGKLGLIGGAGAAGYGAGMMISDWLKGKQYENPETGYKGDVLDHLIYEAGSLFGADFAKDITKELKAGQAEDVQLRQKELGSWQPTMNPVNQQPAAAPQPAQPVAGGFPAAAPVIHDRPQKVVVELATPQLKASVQPTRGATN